MKLLSVQELGVMHNLTKQRTLPDLAIILAVFRYINSNSNEDGLLFCKPRKTQTTAQDIFNLLAIMGRIH